MRYDTLAVVVSIAFITVGFFAAFYSWQLAAICVVLSWLNLMAYRLTSPGER